MAIEIHDLEVFDAGPPSRAPVPADPAGPAAPPRDGLDEDALGRWYRETVLRSARLSTD